jgi:guanylate kinase
LRGSGVKCWPLNTMNTFDKHQLRICRDTVRNPAKGIFLGGPDAEEAEQILREKFNYTDEQIQHLKK